MKRIAVLCLLVVTALSLAGTAAAQGLSQTGILRGTVTSADRLSLPGATVTVTSPALQGERTAVTQSDGSYLFRGLPPGVYNVTIAMSGMTSSEQIATVALGGVTEVNIVMQLAAVQETVTVTGEAPLTALTTPTVGANIRREEVEALANRRDLQGIANLSPAVTEGTTPNAGQLNINGAFAYDNMFMINGVDVNDNLFGSPQNVFIEDAIEETQVLTSGIAAEYGRFSGGVVNAITKSGGNTFSGSYRMNLSNPTWSVKTPYEVSKNVNIKSTLSKTHEVTFGGPILRDKIWFFTAGRLAKTSLAPTLPLTGVGYDRTTDNKRGEVKFTVSPSANHTFQVNYINSPTTDGPRPSIGGYEIDPGILINRKTTNYIVGTNWRGTLGSNLFAEAGFSLRKFAFLNAGGSSKIMNDSPIWSLTQGAYLYNGTYFDANDPEYRNNRQVTASLSYSAEKGGRHDFKGGWEWYRSQRTGGNSQSATSYVFDADYLTGASGLPLLDSDGRIIPVFVPGESYIEHWMPTLGAKMDTDTHSFFIQDHWALDPRLSVDLGLRYEQVKSKSTGNIIGVDTNTLVPRLAVAFDPQANGKMVFHATYAHYSGRYNDAQIGANSPVGNPSLTMALYNGPAGQGRDFAPGFDPANYTDIFLGQFPLANIFLNKGMSSPITKEFTLSAGGEVGAKGSAEVSYVWRRMSNFIEDFIDIQDGVTDVVVDGLDYGTFTNITYANTDVPKRDYQGFVFQGTYRLRSNWQVAGNWTLQIKNDGNFAGEAANQPGIGSIYGNYPGAGGLPSMYDPERHYPIGRLYDFQRSKLRLWTIYNQSLGRAGRLTGSLLVRSDSGLPYSLIATNVNLTAIQNNLLAQQGYPDTPGPQSLYFGGRGTQFFKGYTLFDTSINYEIPVFKSVRPWLKFDIYNLLNNQKLMSWNITVRPDAASPKDSRGLATGYTKGATFGTATSAGMYPQPFQGQNGGRTFRVALGLRW